MKIFKEALEIILGVIALLLIVLSIMVPVAVVGYVFYLFIKILEKAAA